MMKTFAAALVATALAASPALAQSRASDRSADALNARVLEILNAQRAPVVVSAPVTAPARAETAARDSGVYVSGGVGYGGADWTQWSNTLGVGYQFNRYLAAEVTGDFSYANATRTAGQAFFLNARASVPTGTALTPYVVGGVGVGVNGYGNAAGNASTLFDFGAGMNYAINRNWQIDGRYRRIEGINLDRNGDNVFSVAVNYRF